MRPLKILPLALAAAYALGCTGTVHDAAGGGAQPAGGADPSSPSGSDRPRPPGGSSGSDPAADPPAPPSAQVACGNARDIVGRRTLRRLTIPELENTIRTVFALDRAAWSGLTVPPDPGSADGFNNNVDQLNVGEEYARGAGEGAREVAALVSSAAKLAELVPCHATGDRSCAQSFLDTVARRLYRRPLSAEEQARYLGLFESSGTAGPDFGNFVYWAVSTMLQSPHVLYRSEVGVAEGDRFKLSAYEVASGLAYTFTGGPPSDALLDLAAVGRLSTGDEVQAAARALMLDEAGAVRPAFRTTVQGFSDQWLGLVKLSNLKKDETAFPDFTTGIQEALAEETKHFLDAVLFEGRGTVADLLTAPYTFTNAQLAQFYGFGNAPGGDFVRVERPAGWGVGLLSQASMLAVEAHSLQTSPTKRGAFIRTKLMCGVIPPPPAVVGNLPEPTEAETTRQRYEELHSADASCKACHQLMDPIGFAFEHLDATGRYREREGRFDIDDSGVVTGTSAGDILFRGPTELATALARLPEVSDCLAAHIAAYAFGISRESATCLINNAADELRAGGTLMDFFLALARSDHFRYRQP